MMTRTWMGVSVVVLLCGLTASAEEKGTAEAARVVRLPVTGLKAGCCDTAVGKTIGALPGVDAFSIEEEKSGKQAVIRLKKDASLELSKVQEALARATADMGKGMGTEYKLDTAAVVVDASVAFRIAPIADEAKGRLDKALAELKGFESSVVKATGKDSVELTLTFKEKSAGTLDAVTKILKDGKIEVQEVVFRGAATDDKEGAAGGFTCPMCGGSFADAGKCPKCGMALVAKGEDKKEGGGCCGDK